LLHLVGSSVLLYLIMSSLTYFQQTICHSLVSLICYNIFPVEKHLLLKNMESKQKNEMTNKMLQNKTEAWVRLFIYNEES